MSQLTLNEIIEEKLKAEQKIKDVLQQFKDKTGLEYFECSASTDVDYGATGKSIPVIIVKINGSI